MPFLNDASKKLSPFKNSIFLVKDNGWAWIIHPILTTRNAYHNQIVQKYTTTLEL